MKLAVIFLLPLLLASGVPDRLTHLVGEMKRLTLAGDHPAVGLLVPALLEELTKPQPNAAIAWNQVGVYFAAQGSFADAERAYQGGIRLIEKEGASGGRLALLLLNLAGLYLETGGRPAQAEVLCRRGLKAAVEIHGPDAPELSNFLYTLGMARQQQGDFKDARRYFEQALACGDQSQRGIFFGSLAVNMALEKDWIPARDNLQQSIQWTERRFGPSHPFSIRGHLNLARVHLQLRQWAPAGAALERARQITETSLGPQHPLMAEILHTSASVHRKTGHRREARDLERRAKAIAAAQPKNPAAEFRVHVADLMQPGRR